MTPQVRALGTKKKKEKPTFSNGRKTSGEKRKGTRPPEGVPTIEPKKPNSSERNGVGKGRTERTVKGGNHACHEETFLCGKGKGLGGKVKKKRKAETRGGRLRPKKGTEGAKSFIKKGRKHSDDRGKRDTSLGKSPGGSCDLITS